MSHLYELIYCKKQEIKRQKKRHACCSSLRPALYLFLSHTSRVTVAANDARIPEMSAERHAPRNWHISNDMIVIIIMQRFNLERMH